MGYMLETQKRRVPANLYDGPMRSIGFRRSVDSSRETEKASEWLRRVQEDSECPRKFQTSSEAQEITETLRQHKK